MSRVLVFQSIFQDNQPSGVRVDPGGVVQISDSVVQRNGVLGGIRVFGGHANIFGSNVIQNNANAGIEVDGGSVDLFAFDSQPQIINNRIGIELDRAKISQFGNILIQGNSNFGLLVQDGSSAILNGSRPTTQLPTIQQNGTAGNFFSGGILIQHNSHLDMFSEQVVNNLGRGLIVRNDSSASIQNATITGNSGVGVTVFILSSAQVFGDTVSGNGGIDLQCSPDSFASGNSSGIQNVFCPHFNVEPLPGP